MINLPAKSNNAQTWFTQLHAIFNAKRITSQSVRFAYVVEKLPPDVASEVSHLLSNVPSERPYDTLRDVILQRTGYSEEIFSIIYLWDPASHHSC